jgi:hypothetical protein
MRIHTDLDSSDIYAALSDAKEEGHVPATVHIELEEHGSRARERAFDVRLYSNVKTPGDGRRRANTGNHGASEEWAATWDEWGFFFAALYDADESAIVGSSPARATYTDRAQFHETTRYRYDHEYQKELAEFEAAAV